jgi:hypothetical protein
MLCSTLHIPPMPVIVQKIDTDDNTIIDDESVESSHDIIAGLVAFACSNMTEKDHNERKMHQILLQHDFYDELDSIKDINAVPEETLYNFYARHTQDWMRAYTKKLNNHYANFKPFDYVVNGDKIHQQMHSYAKAQCLIHSEGKNEVQLESSVPYLTLLRMCAKWESEYKITPLHQTESTPDPEDQMEEERLEYGHQSNDVLNPLQTACRIHEGDLENPQNSSRSDSE